MSPSAGQKFVSIATAHDQTEAIRIRMLLDRARIPYRVKGEQLHNLYGIAGTTIFGPMEFIIPAELAEEAEESLTELFDIDTEVPEVCPACGQATSKGAIDCIGCGLFLG